MSDPHQAQHTQRPATYYLAPTYKGAPRVVLLVGTGWRPTMRNHYGLIDPPLFCRQAYPGEPSRAGESGHPWGWVFKPDQVIEYERASGMPSGTLVVLSQSLAVAQQAWLPAPGTALQEHR